MKKLLLILIGAGMFSCLHVDAQCKQKTHRGDGTYYTYNGGGNCSYPGAAKFSAAMNQSQYANSKICGACVKITGKKGSVTVKIEDRCPECKKGDIDLNKKVFSRIDLIKNGRVPIKWKLVPCGVKGNIKFVFKTGSTKHWSAVQIRNHRYPISTVEYKKGNKWVNLPRAEYNYFLASSGMGAGPYTFRITDINGKRITQSRIPLKVNKVIVGTKQFPRCRKAASVSTGNAFVGNAELNSGTRVVAYPNPVSESLNVELIGMPGGVVSLYNIEGKEVYRQTVHESFHVIPNMQSFNHGLYLLKVISDNNQVYTNKVIVNE